MKQLICLHCQYELTRPVRLGTITHVQSSYVHLEWESAANVGEALLIDMSIDAKPECTDNVEIRKTCYWLNREDMLSRSKLDQKLYVGCCGPNGNLNWRCTCGALIAREFGDCLGPHYVSPEAGRTDWIDYIFDEEERNTARRQRFYIAGKDKKTHRNRHKK